MKRLLFLLLFIAILFSVSASFAGDPVPVETITLNESSVVVPINKVINLKTVIEPKNATNKKVVWTSSDESIATVKNGQVKCVGVGTAVITVEAQDGCGASATVEIKVVTPVKKITLSEKKPFPWLSGFPGRSQP